MEVRQIAARSLEFRRRFCIPHGRIGERKVRCPLNRERQLPACSVRGDAGLEVLLGRRNSALRFMAGHHVFPGGRVQDDERIDVVSHAAIADQARAIAAAAREVFEETGLLTVRGTLPPREEVQQARRSVIEGQLGFGDFLAQHAASRSTPMIFNRRATGSPRTSCPSASTRGTFSIISAASSSRS